MFRTDAEKTYRADPGQTMFSALHQFCIQQTFGMSEPKKPGQKAKPPVPVFKDMQKTCNFKSHQANDPHVRISSKSSPLSGKTRKSEISRPMVSSLPNFP